jgi:methyltransferase
MPDTVALVIPRWYPLLSGLVGVQRLRELRLSRRLEANVRDGRPAAARTYPLMVALHVALFAAPLGEIVGLRRRPRAPLLWVGVLGGATALRWWCIRTLGPAWNARALVPSDLRPVTSGPYRYVRHPNYVAVALEFLALPLAGGAWLSALALSALNGFVLWDRIRDEERLLAAVPGYEEAFRGRARFIPRVL